MQTLVARATKAFLDYAPMRWCDQEESERVYRHIPYGKDLDVFVIDMRSDRGPNTANLQPSFGLQFFWQVDIDARSKDMMVALKDIHGNEVFSQRLHARPCKGWGRDDE